MGPPVEWSRYGADADPSLDPVQWAANMQEIFSQLHDSDYNLKQPRHYIPVFVLHMFCKPAQGKAWASLDPNRRAELLRIVAAQRKLTHACPSWQMVSKESQLSEDDTFLIYDTDTKRFDKLHWAECFKYEDAYQKFFDKFTPQDLAKDKWTFKKFETLQKVDKQIINGLCTSVWNIYGVINEKHAKSLETISLKRSDIWDLRKNLFLLTFLRNRDRNTHMIGTFPNMDEAREKRKKFMTEQGMGHPRDVWLHNAATILETPHHQVGHSPKVFDFDREDYRANARERFLVFWEAGHNDEFILTDNSFGAFEGCLLGSKHGMTINMKPADYSKRMYTRDFMWHQLFVLSPKLVVALCHGTLINPALTRAQRGRYGLRPSVLDKLPHPLPENYYKDLHTGECRFIKSDWDIPEEVQDLFGRAGERTRYVANLDTKASSDIEFKVSVLSTAQVALVNMILLQNQSSQTTVDSIVYRNPAAIYRAIDEFEKVDWACYTDEKQNSYRAFRKKIFSQFNKGQTGSSATSPISPLTAESKSKPGSENGRTDDAKSRKTGSENGQPDDAKSRKLESDSGQADDATSSKSEPTSKGASSEKVKIEVPTKKSTEKVDAPKAKVTEVEQPLLELVEDIEAAMKKDAKEIKSEIKSKVPAKPTTNGTTTPNNNIKSEAPEDIVLEAIKTAVPPKMGALATSAPSSKPNTREVSSDESGSDSEEEFDKNVPKEGLRRSQSSAKDRSNGLERNKSVKSKSEKQDSDREGRPKAKTSKSDDKPRRSRSKGALERPEMTRASRTENDKRPELVRASRTDTDARRPDKSSQTRLEREREKVRQDKREREREKEAYDRYEREKEKERLEKEKERLERDKERLEKQKLERERLERQALEKERQELERQKREFAKEKEELLKTQMQLQTVARMEKEKTRNKEEALRVQMEKLAALEEERKLEKAREKELREHEKREKERLANEQKELNCLQYERDLAIEKEKRQREKEEKDKRRTSRYIRTDRSEHSDEWDPRDRLTNRNITHHNHSPKSEPAVPAHNMRYDGDMTPPSSSHSHPDNQLELRLYDSVSSQSPPSPQLPYDYPPSPPRRQETQPQSPKKGNRVSRMLLPGFDSPPSSGFPSYPSSPLESPHLDLAPYQAPKDSRKDKRVRRFESPSPLPALDSHSLHHPQLQAYRQMMLVGPHEENLAFSTLADRDDEESWEEGGYNEGYQDRNMPHHAVVRYDQPKNRRLQLESPPLMRRKTSPPPMTGQNNKPRRSNTNRFDLR